MRAKRYNKASLACFKNALSLMSEQNFKNHKNLKELSEYAKMPKMLVYKNLKRYEKIISCILYLQSIDRPDI